MLRSQHLERIVVLVPWHFVTIKIIKASCNSKRARMRALMDGCLRVQKDNKGISRVYTNVFYFVVQDPEQEGDLAGSHLKFLVP